MYIYIYVYVCVCVSLCNPMDTRGKLGVHNTFRRCSMTTSGNLVCFQLTSCVLGVRVYL